MARLHCGFQAVQDSGSMTTSTLMNDNRFIMRMEDFATNLRGTMRKIYKDTDLMRYRLPISDNVNMHIMPHPCRRIYYGSHADLVILSQVYNTFTEHAGYFNGVYLDPVLQDDGSYAVRSGNDTLGCQYPTDEA